MCQKEWSGNIFIKTQNVFLIAEVVTTSSLSIGNFFDNFRIFIEYPYTINQMFFTR